MASAEAENNLKVKKQISRCSLMRRFVKCSRSISWYRRGSNRQGESWQSGIIRVPRCQRLRKLPGSFREKHIEDGSL